MKEENWIEEIKEQNRITYFKRSMYSEEVILTKQSNEFVKVWSKIWSLRARENTKQLRNDLRLPEIGSGLNSKYWLILIENEANEPNEKEVLTLFGSSFVDESSDPT